MDGLERLVLPSPAEGQDRDGWLSGETRAGALGHGSRGGMPTAKQERLLNKALDLSIAGRLRLDSSANQEDIMLKLNVAGMTCGHCAQTVTKAVEAVPAVKRAVVDLKAGEVAVEGNADEGTVRQAIADAGYDVRDAA
jgi:copper chaperone